MEDISAQLESLHASIRHCSAIGIGIYIVMMPVMRSHVVSDKNNGVLVIS